MATIRKSTKPDEEVASGDWTFARDIEGQQNEKVILDWSFEVPGGGRFTDQAHATLHQQMTFTCGQPSTMVCFPLGHFRRP